MDYLNHETRNSHGNILSGLYGVVLNITNRCNLKCLHCFNRSSISQDYDSELTDEEVLELIDELIDIKVQNICFSGGEPLARKELLLQCLENCMNSGISTSIVSNGTFIDRNVANTLKKNGISEIEISLDGVRKETHEKLRCIRGCFEKAINSIELLTNRGIATSVSFTLTNFNYSEFALMVELVSKFNISGVYVRPLLKMGTALEQDFKYMPQSCHYRYISKEVSRLKKRFSEFEIMNSDPINHIIQNRGKNCIPYVEIQADGRLLCSYCIPYSFGNVRKHSLKDYWESGLQKVWQLPCILKKAKMVDGVGDIPVMIESIQGEKENSFSHFDLVDDKDLLWA